MNYLAKEEEITLKLKENQQNIEEADQNDLLTLRRNISFY